MMLVFGVVRQTVPQNCSVSGLFTSRTPTYIEGTEIVLKVEFFVTLQRCKYCTTYGRVFLNKITSQKHKLPSFNTTRLRLTIHVFVA